MVVEQIWVETRGPAWGFFDAIMLGCGIHFPVLRDSVVPPRKLAGDVDVKSEQFSEHKCDANTKSHLPRTLNPHSAVIPTK